jgi:hypothetical protein
MDYADSSNPNYWTSQLHDWSRTKGLEDYIGSGLADSTVGKSGFFDAGTIADQAFRAKNLAEAQSIIGQAPVTGINPTAGAQQLQQAQAGTAQQARAGLNAAIQGSQGNAQSTMDWINQLMGSQSEFANAHQQNWQNYEQAMYNNAIQNAASRNSGMGSIFSGIGGGIGSALGGLNLGGSGTENTGGSNGKVGGTASGALQGAQMGSAAGPYGPAIGALLGGAAGYFSS